MALSERPTGPITLKQRQFFELMKPQQKPHPEVSGVILVERTSQAWLAAAAIGAVATIVLIMLGVELSSTKAALAQRDIEIGALKAAATSAAATVADEAKAAAKDQAKEQAQADATAKMMADAKVKEALAVLDPRPIVDALNAKLAADIKKGDVKVALDAGPTGDPRVRVTVQNSALFDGKQSSLAKRGEDLASRLGAVLAGLDGRIDVVAHTDHTAGRGETELGKSAGRAVSFARAMTEKTKLDSRRVTAAARGNADHARKVDVVISAAPRT